jgi:hypothetical protein
MRQHFKKEHEERIPNTAIKSNAMYVINNGYFCKKKKYISCQKKCHRINYGKSSGDLYFGWQYASFRSAYCR